MGADIASECLSILNVRQPNLVYPPNGTNLHFVSRVRGRWPGCTTTVSKPALGNTQYAVKYVMKPLISHKMTSQ